MGSKLEVYDRKLERVLTVQHKNTRHDAVQEIFKIFSELRHQEHPPIIPQGLEDKIAIRVFNLKQRLPEEVK